MSGWGQSQTGFDSDPGASLLVGVRVKRDLTLTPVTQKGTYGSFANAQDDNHGRINY